VNDREQAQRYLDQLQVHYYGDLPSRLPADRVNAIKDFIDRLSRETELTPLTPHQRAEMERIVARDGQIDVGMLYGRESARMADKLDHIETVLEKILVQNLERHTTKSPDIRLGMRPIVGFLPTGQFNAITMPAPRTDAHLTVFHDGLWFFIDKFCTAISLALPRDESARHGRWCRLHGGHARNASAHYGRA
jgi:hypothetical protein